MGAVGERGARRQELVAVEHAEHRLQHQHQPERHDHAGERTVVRREAHQAALDAEAERSAGDEPDGEAQPVRAGRPVTA